MHDQDTLPQVSIWQTLRLPILLPLTLLGCFSIGLLLFRIKYTGTPYFSFLLWNLFLALIPLGISTVFRLGRERFPGSVWLGLCFLAWLPFFPNAPYIVTDLIHLQERLNMPVWFDALLIFSFALCGLMAGFLSLWDFEQAVAKRWGVWSGVAFSASALFLGGIGIYLGRFLRWNSWDLLHHPLAVLQDSLQPFLQPRSFLSVLAVIGFVFLFQTCIYLCFRQMFHSPHEESYSLL
jgi:uncharacterized membrane protein